MSIQIHVPDHILYEDHFIIVLYKPCSLMVEPDRNGHPNLLHQVRRYIKISTPQDEEVYAQHIHRIDRPVSGIVLFAKQKAVLKNLSEQFAERKVKKYYQALTEKAPPQVKGVLVNWHRKEKKKGIIYETHHPFTEKVSLQYEIKKFSDDRFLWNIELHTGKYHQIRAQLSYAEYPIIGDSLYDSTIPYKPDSIALHASKLVFLHPVTQEQIAIEKENEF